MKHKIELSAEEIAQAISWYLSLKEKGHKFSVVFNIDINLNQPLKATVEVLE